MSMGETIEETGEHCTRGLEYRTNAGSQKRQFNKWSGMNAVLDEQHRQRVDGILDDEAIADVYKAAAHKCQQEALGRGLADAEALVEKPAVVCYPARGCHVLDSQVCVCLSSRPLRSAACSP